MQWLEMNVVTELTALLSIRTQINTNSFRHHWFWSSLTMCTGKTFESQYKQAYLARLPPYHYSAMKMPVSSFLVSLAKIKNHMLCSAFDVTAVCNFSFSAEIFKIWNKNVSFHEAVFLCTNFTMPDRQQLLIKTVVTFSLY